MVWSDCYHAITTLPRVHEFPLHCCSYAPFKVITLVNMLWSHDYLATKSVRVLFHQTYAGVSFIRQASTNQSTGLFDWFDYGLTAASIEQANQNHQMYTASYFVKTHTSKTEYGDEAQFLQLINSACLFFKLICVESKTLRVIVISYSVYHNHSLVPRPAFACITVNRTASNGKPASPASDRAKASVYSQIVKLLY